MSSLVDEVTAQSGRPGVKGCAVDRFLDEQEAWPLPEGKDRRFTRAEWEEVLGNPRLQHSSIHAVLKQYGFAQGRSSVGRHRIGDCPCQKS